MVIIKTVIQRTTSTVSPIRKNVAFEVVLNKKVNVIPHLIVYNGSFYVDDAASAKSYTLHPSASKGNSFFFELLNQEVPRYFSLVTKEDGVLNYLISNYHFEPGDNIIVTANFDPELAAYNLDFSGTGSAKYCCQNEFNKSILLDNTKIKPQFTPLNGYNRNNKYTRNRRVFLAVIEKFKPEMTYYSYELLKADVITREGKMLISGFEQRMSVCLAEDEIQTYLLLSHDYRNNLKLGPLEKISPKIKYNSKEYSLFMVDKIVCDYLEKYVRMNFTKVYHIIRKIGDSDLRDKMSVVFMIKYKEAMKGNYRALMKHVLADVENEECLEKLTAFSMLK